MAYTREIRNPKKTIRKMKSQLNKVEMYERALNKSPRAADSIEWKIEKAEIKADNLEYKQQKMRWGDVDPFKKKRPKGRVNSKRK